MKRIALTLCGMFCVIVGSTSAGSDTKAVESTRLVVVPEHLASDPKPSGRTLAPDWSAMPSGAGVFTTLSGFYDYQANTNVQHIQVNPANGNIHVIYMLSEDSTAVSDSRRTGYAFSTDGGSTWNNFSQVRVPARRSGFGTIDLLKGPNAGLPVIANHSTVGGTLRTTAFVDSPEGTGLFTELQTPPAFGTNEPIWPRVAGPADGSIVVASSRGTPEATNHFSRTGDFISWSAWAGYPGRNENAGRHPMVANGTGRVGALVNSPGTSFSFRESTNNGISWPASATELRPDFWFVGADTMGAWVGEDLVYNGDSPLIVVNTTRYSPSQGWFFRGAGIDFWSGATGWVRAVEWDSLRNAASMVPQALHLSQGYPVIGMSGGTIVVAFHSFEIREVDTLSGGRFYGDIYYTYSHDGGLTWAAPENITNTPTLDERYPSISKWNAPGEANITWQEDTRAGSHVNDGVPVSRSYLKYMKLTLPTTSVGEDEPLAASFRLRQNYPNPFNPATKINYTLPTGSDVKLSVFNVLGQEIATLVDDYRSAGTYEVIFDGTDRSSGIYFYTLKAGGYVDTRKMMLLR